MALLDEIAENAGVSRSLVAKVLSGKRTATRQGAVDRAAHIRRVARDLGYVPNRAARAVSTGRFNSISLLSGAAQGSPTVNARLIEGILSGLEGQEAFLSCSYLPPEKMADTSAMPLLLREMSSDGFLIDYRGSVPEHLERRVHDHKLPVIWINEKQEQDCVYPEDRAGARLGTEHLIATGRRKISYVSFARSKHYSARERRQGYIDAMYDAGLESNEITPSPRVSEEHRQELLQDILQSEAPPDALLCYGSGDACPAYAAALRLGIRVPEQLSIVAFSDELLTELGETMTTLVVPVKEMGRKAVGELFAKLDHPAQERRSVAMPVALIRGKTS